MEKLDMKSTDLVEDNMAYILQRFPNCVTEGADGKVIDFDLLKAELTKDSTAIVEGNKERYRLEWPGKREAIVTANMPTNKTLRPIREDSVNFDTTENIYIEGDNLEVLKILQESYLNKIKMIYIDPPYNTGKDFVYKDNFRKSTEDELQDSGQVDEYNQRLVANPDTAGRYHSDWLSMMYPRLKLARNLLTDDGVIFISIDDNEVHNLRKVCDEVFGEGNFISVIIWRKKYGLQNDAKYFSTSHEYLVTVSKDKNIFRPNLVDRTEHQDKRYKNPDSDIRGPWKSADLSVGRVTEKDRYEIITPSGRVVNPPEGRSWVYSKEKFKELLKDNRIWFGKTGNNVPSVKKFLTEVKQGLTPDTFWDYDDVGHTDGSNKALKLLFDGKSFFDYPKPVAYLKKIITIGSSERDIILDFFSGSASLSEAVMSLNQEKDSNRKYIQVQLPEATDKKSEAYKAGYQNICEIGKERIRRSGKKIVAEQQAEVDKKKAALEKAINGRLTEVKGKYVFPEQVMIDETAEELLQELNDLRTSIDKLDIGFRVYRLDSSNMKEVYYRPQHYTQTLLDNLYNNVKEDRNDEDLLIQILLDWGLPLSLKIEKVTIADKTVFKIEENSLYACFDKGIDENFAKAIAKEKPLRIVFRDASFKNDTAKVNVEQTLKQLSVETEMRVI